MRGELETYRKKRRFGETPEPKGAKGRRTKGAPLRYLIQRHAATRLHYDFRIEFDGVLKSWAVTKAPSRDPAVKRLAVEVEDHPLDYGRFEGTIPSGNYGAGTVQMWDAGTWTPQAPETLEADFARGSVKMWLDGERLKGGWALVRLKSDRGRSSKRNNWLLIKEKDEQAVPGEGDANMEIDASVTTGRSLAEIAEGRKQWTASKPVARKGPAKPKARAAVTAKANKPHAFTPLQMCKPVDYPPGGSGWVHEIKFDGYRLQVATGGGRATVRTRKGLDWSAKFPELAGDAADWPDAVIDGELCALDGEHRPDFSALQAAISDEATGGLVYFAFDLLFEGPEDLRDLPLSHRKARLQAYIDRIPKGARRRIRSSTVVLTVWSGSIGASGWGVSVKPAINGRSTSRPERGSFRKKKAPPLMPRRLPPVGSPIRRARPRDLQSWAKPKVAELLDASHRTATGPRKRRPAGRITDAAPSSSKRVSR
jgi:bifunctional non-homologous end joining protein LigD